MSGSRAPRVLVTRSEPGASETAGRLEAKGFAAVVEPLFAIAPIAVTVPDFDALAFTSANGARRFATLSARRDAPVFCVGARTAQAAREAGFKNVTSADGDVGALAALIARGLQPSARLLHAGNAESRGDLAGQLRAAGHAADFLAIFRAEPVAAPGPHLAAHLAGEAPVEAILIHSPRAAVILAEFATKQGGGGAISAAAISQAAAEPLARLGARLEVAATPDETALISALQRLVFG